MSGLIESLQAHYTQLPPAVRDVHGLGVSRAEAIAAAYKAGLPSARSESWKYTPLRALARRSFVPARSAQVDEATRQRLLDIPAPRMVFVNGQYQAELSELPELGEGISWQPLSSGLQGDDPRAVNFLARQFDRDEEPFARFNAALACEGSVLRIAAGVELLPTLHIVHVGRAEPEDASWHLRSLIELREGARARVVEHWLGSDHHRGLCTVVTHVHLKPGAELEHLRVQDEAAGATLFSRSDVQLGKEARYRRLDLELGLGLSRHELNIAFHGKGARAEANGVMLADGKAHVDTRLGIDHALGDTTCSLVWRGLGRGHGRVAFHGGILIREGADGSDAMLSNKNLLLSADAEIDTQPVLVIHADEVKAAHGATVGKLDPTALFYLRSRGLPLVQAQQLLTSAFCHELLAAISEPDLRRQLGAQLDAALSRSELG